MESDVQCTTVWGHEHYKVFLTWPGIFLYYYAQFKNNVCKQICKFQRMTPNSNSKRCPNPPQATQQPLSEQNINILFGFET